MNLAIVVGNLGQDPEAREVNGKTVVNFSVATSDMKDKTDWHKIVVWEALADNCKKFLVKGSKVAVQGRMQTRSYEKQGLTCYTTEIIASKVEFLSSPKESVAAKEAPRQKLKESGEEFDEFQVPF